MGPPVVIIGLVLIPVLLLVSLLFWRFYGSGKDEVLAKKKINKGNYKALKKYRYDIKDYIESTNKNTTVNLEPSSGSILADLVSEEEYIKSENTAEISDDWDDFEENLFDDSGERPGVVNFNSVSTDSNEEAFVPGVRQSITTDDVLEIEEVENPPQSLFHNPITAPAPTDNDKKNREAEIALKKRRRAELKNSSSYAQSGLGELFSPDSTGKNSIIPGHSDKK